MQLPKLKIATSLALFITLFTIGATTTVGLAQSDPNHPTPVGIDRQVQNSWSSDRVTNFYYSFVAGSGET